MSDGTSLEKLVAFVEKLHLPSGFTVKPRDRVVIDGVQIAELDILIEGPVGSTNFSWLIECRDRPSEGAQGGDWIEQLVGRRGRFSFDKVTAVSTTGFSAPARQYATQTAIELREVRALSPEEFEPWLTPQIRFRPSLLHRHMTSAKFFIDERESEEKKRAMLRLAELSKSFSEPQRVLKSTKSGEKYFAHEAFGFATDQRPEWYDTLEPGGPRKKVKINVRYTNDDDHFVVETDAGDVRLSAIAFEGEIWMEPLGDSMHGVTEKKEYVKVTGDAPISTFAAYEPMIIGDREFTLELHHLAETGETHVVAKMTPKKKA